MLLLQLSVRATMHHGNVGKVAGQFDVRVGIIFQEGKTLNPA
jgi:hypothetical protein